MAKYKVEWVEVVKEGVGERGAWKKSKMSLTELESGQKEENVSTFLEVMAGQEIEGNVVMNEQYHTKEFKKSLEKPNFMKKPDISKQVETAQKRTEASITKTMDRKEESIKLASAQRDAVLIVSTLLGGKSGYEDDNAIKRHIIHWRNWFLNDETFNNPPPFN